MSKHGTELQSGKRLEPLLITSVNVLHSNCMYIEQQLIAMVDSGTITEEIAKQINSSNKANLMLIESKAKFNKIGEE